MKTLAQSFLTPAEQDRINRCVQEAEKQTSGEIVPMIASASHHYLPAAIYGATFISLPVALLVTHLLGASFWIGPDNMWLFLACFILLYAISYPLVQNIGWLKRRFLLPARAEEEVKAAAIQTFFTEKLYRTRAQNGILLYISVFERRVWILADSGINEKISQEQWQEIVDSVTSGIRKKRQADAICEAVTRIGSILKEWYPYKKDDRDELHNLIIN